MDEMQAMIDWIFFSYLLKKTTDTVTVYSIKVTHRCVSKIIKCERTNQVDRSATACCFARSIGLFEQLTGGYSNHHFQA
ncbi:MAG: hypothetical protein IBX55_07820 [Methyloprofundus sp.]|nr:hypothetical protein [Methyloprofundus sp.]